jgi:hypothetical protein
VIGDRNSGFENPSVEEIRALLKHVRSIAVVGLSPNPDRPSHGVARAMQGFGYTIVPVHPAAGEILGAKVYSRLSHIPEPIDLVDVFRRPEHIDAVVDECLGLNLKNLWIQDDIINIPAAIRARARGMAVIMNRCIYRDYVQYCR